EVPGLGWVQGQDDGLHQGAGTVRILTTHVGSLPRPDDLLALIRTREQGGATDPVAFEARVSAAVEEVVRKQVTASLDIVNDAERVFMTAVSPGQAARFLVNRYYPSHDAYIAALADVLKREYAAIVRAGFLLQLDCPDLGSGRNNQFQHLSLHEFRKVAALHVAALNHAVADLPPDRMRLHVCWGNYEGP